MSKVRITPELLIIAYNRFQGNVWMRPWRPLGRSELRALERKGYVKAKLFRGDHGGFFWMYQATPKLWKEA